MVRAMTVRINLVDVRIVEASSNLESATAPFYGSLIAGGRYFEEAMPSPLAQVGIWFSFSDVC
jgi:hypothetical protein